jgi:hypothetical protein
MRSCTVKAGPGPGSGPGPVPHREQLYWNRFICVLCDPHLFECSMRGWIENSLNNTFMIQHTNSHLTHTNLTNIINKQQRNQRTATNINKQKATICKHTLQSNIFDAFISILLLFGFFFVTLFADV